MQSEWWSTALILVDQVRDDAIDHGAKQEPGGNISRGNMSHIVCEK